MFHGGHSASKHHVEGFYNGDSENQLFSKTLWMIPAVTWCKLGNSSNCNPVEETDHFKIEWKKTEGEAHSGFSFLQFTNSSLNDTGLYWCETTGNMSSVSHFINVTITAAPDQKNVMPTNLTTVFSSDVRRDRVKMEGWLPYVYASAGILVLILTVTVAFCFLMRRRKGSKSAAKQTQSKSRTNSRRQHEDEPPQNRPASPRPNLPSRPRSVRNHPAQPHARSSIIYDNAPSRQPSRTKRNAAKDAPRSSNSAAGPVASDGGVIYDNERDEGEAPLVYASLNHHVIRESSSPAHPVIVIEEQTEYAAIRLS
ncbi:hypothetical protein MATL_G00153780 [Megalops atlanticus]|uniref:Ig-like domain-containing protein n=1 Tax=Megalops atlanticus TaxID=7932 RepID=A0A9D3T2I3_MEGAT|nr:hypothetical protein MATL_G00153780 [Megalops atlanticus]